MGSESNNKVQTKLVHFLFLEQFPEMYCFIHTVSEKRKHTLC